MKLILTNTKNETRDFFEGTEVECHEQMVTYQGIFYDSECHKWYIQFESNIL